MDSPDDFAFFPELESAVFEFLKRQERHYSELKDEFDKLRTQLAELDLKNASDHKELGGRVEQLESKSISQPKVKP